ncbi:hypothetical protein [Brevundimonas sp. SORGH_AS_0993]|uniref:hypothetical protein n=1 Tax=Brevundimonas sp. SORGH_AS_0993 TaxID=3041794 RepID=UPI00278011BC|nr:hypothetical protein [Brevundimonas sp. SORGH_AS_0993]MDQ1155522.1 hypothetical protein [Brevundimonas sp. SORGH_AS_0993]
MADRGSAQRGRLPTAAIRQGLRLPILSLHDVEELVFAQGIEVGSETIRCWTIKFGPQIARRLKKLRLCHFSTVASRQTATGPKTIEAKTP